jgi:L-glyceraldehyde 3-phosphate reductase
VIQIINGAATPFQQIEESFLKDVANSRYERMPYRRAGRSGLKLGALSLGLWQNFGASRDYASAFEIVAHAFDAGVTHFDFANNYGPPPGASEELFGLMLKRDLGRWRDEMIIASKAGFEMWPGPYGNWGSRKYLMASADQSLKRLGIDYFDVFYSHRFDPETPLEETMGALADLVRQGKALYVGVSSYPEQQTREAHAILAKLGVPLSLHQPSYSIVNRWIEQDGTIDACRDLGVGIVAYGTLGHGLLSGKHSKEVGSVGGGRALPQHHQDSKAVAAADRLAQIAAERGQTPVQLALSWVLRRPEITSALVGVRTLDQLKDNLNALAKPPLSADEIAAIDRAAHDGLIDRKPSW